VRQSKLRSQRLRYKKQPVDVCGDSCMVCGVFVHVIAGGSYSYHHFNGLNVPPEAVCTE